MLDLKTPRHSLEAFLLGDRLQRGIPDLLAVAGLEVVVVCVDGYVGDFSNWVGHIGERVIQRL